MSKQWYMEHLQNTILMQLLKEREYLKDTEFQMNRLLSKNARQIEVYLVHSDVLKCRVF